ncbi:MAG: hypothetical protein UIH27_07690, partial [Ruminococcus sp.]|nr:hypothetical protein [Ruminococcus sp.]
RQSLRSIFRNTSLSSLQGDSLAASSASSCEKYPRKSLSTFYLRLVLDSEKRAETELKKPFLLFCIVIDHRYIFIEKTDTKSYQKDGVI